MLIYNLLFPTNRMKKQYHFCFLFTRIQLLNATELLADSFVNFKIYLLYENSIIGETNEILGISNGQNEIIFDKEEIRYSFTQRNVHLSSKLEIKLIEIIQGTSERLIGCYQFGINNYIHISDQLNRHCVELNIQIGENYSITYEVFIDSLKQGVDQIKQEHQLSKALIKQDESDGFFPEEIQYFPLRTITKEIKLDSENCVVVNQRYWSPTWRQMHTPPKRQPRRRNLAKKSSINQTSFSKIERQNSQSFLRDLKIAESTIDDLDKLERLAQSQVDDQQMPILQPQLEESNNSQTEEKTMAQMYHVIRSNSRITLPLPEQSIQTREQITGETKKQGRSSKRIVNVKSLKNYIAIFILILLGAMLILQQFRGSSFKESRQMRKHAKQYAL